MGTKQKTKKPNALLACISMYRQLDCFYAANAVMREQLDKVDGLTTRGAALIETVTTRSFDLTEAIAYAKARTMDEVERLAANAAVLTE